jgi:hypothetical protein
VQSLVVDEVTRGVRVAIADADVVAVGDELPLAPADETGEPHAVTKTRIVKREKRITPNT